MPKSPTTVGVPEIVPVAEFRLRPDGRLFAGTDQVPAWPVWASVVEYETARVAFGSDVVLIVGGGVMNSVSAWVSNRPPLVSVYFTVKLAVPPAVGVPVRAPVLAFRVMPAGSAPALIDQVPASPVRVRVCEYAMP